MLCKWFNRDPNHQQFPYKNQPDSLKHPSNYLPFNVSASYSSWSQVFSSNPQTINVETNIHISDFEIFLPPYNSQVNLNLYDVDANVSSDESSNYSDKEYDDVDTDF